MDVTDLASLAANTVVAASVTDAYDTIRDRVARLFGRGNPDPATASRLDNTRADLSDATATAVEQARAVHTAQWQVRFADLVDAYPEAANELAQLARISKPTYLPPATSPTRLSAVLTTAPS